MIEEQGNVLEQAAQEAEADNQSQFGSDDEALENQPSEDNQEEDESEEKPLAEKFKVKVDKEEVEVDLEELKRGYSHGKAAAKKMQEASEYRKEADRKIEEQHKEVQVLRESVSNFTNFIQQMKEDPDLVLSLGKELGIDFEEWAHRKVLKKIQYANMSEVERRAHDLEIENKRFKDEQAKAAKRAEEQKQAQERKQAESRIASEIVDYFEKAGIETPDHDLMERAIEIMKLTKSNPEGRWAFAKAYEYAQNEVGKKGNAAFNTSFLDRAKKGELTEAEIKAFREYEMKNARKKTPRQESQPRRSKEPRYRTIDEAFKDL